MSDAAMKHLGDGSYMVPLSFATDPPESIPGAAERVVSVVRARQAVLMGQDEARADLAARLTCANQVCEALQAHQDYHGKDPQDYHCGGTCGYDLARRLGITEEAKRE